MSSSTLSELHEAARNLANAGVPIFPCVVGGKRPATEHGVNDATTDLDQIDAWWGTADYNIGASPEAIGECVIDLDGPEAEAAWLELQLEHGFAPDTYEIRTPRQTGRHLRFKGSLPPSASKLGPHIDTRGVGSYVVMPPSYSDEHQRHYEAANDVPVAELPDWVAAVLNSRKREHAAAASGVALDAPQNVARARSLLSGYVARGHVAVEGQGGDARTFAIACEVLNMGLTPGAAQQLIEQIWNPHCVPSWDSEELAKKIENAATYAQNEAGAWAVPLARDWIPPETLDRLLAASKAEQEGQASRFNWRQSIALAETPEPQWLIPDLIERASLGIIFGASGQYKTYLATDMALHVAAGIAGYGLPERPRAPVFFVAGEGIARLARRDLPAWKTLHAVEDELPFYVTDEMPLGANEHDWTDFADSILAITKGARPGAIFLDTLHASMLGLEENSATDMGKMVHAQKFLRRVLECAVIFIHHSPDDKSKPRGSTSLFASQDFVLRVEAEPGTFFTRMWVDKMRNFERKLSPFSFEGKKLGGGLVFTPASARAASILADELDLFTTKKIARALANAGMIHPKTMTTYILAEMLVPKLKDEDDETRDEMIKRGAAAIIAAVKKGKHDSYYERKGNIYHWSIVGPSA